MSLDLFFHKFKQVGVVTARESPVAADDDKETPLTGSRHGKGGLEIRVFVGDLGERALHDTQVRLAGHCLVLCPSELGCGDQLHGLGDLHRVLHTLDPQLDCFHISSCHYFPPLNRPSGGSPKSFHKGENS